MRTASDGAERSGLYASPSITTPRIVQTIIAIITESQPGTFSDETVIYEI